MNKAILQSLSDAEELKVKSDTTELVIYIDHSGSMDQVGTFTLLLFHFLNLLIDMIYDMICTTSHVSWKWQTHW
jgi:hypothetical protein